MDNHAVEIGAPDSAPVVPPVIPENLGRILLEPLNHGMAAAERKALELGVPAHDMLNMLMNHLTSILAMIEPPGAREEAIKDVVRSVAPMTQRHYELRHMSPGGVILPKKNAA